MPAKKVVSKAKAAAAKALAVASPAHSTKGETPQAVPASAAPATTTMTNGSSKPAAPAPSPASTRPASIAIPKVEPTMASTLPPKKKVQTPADEGIAFFEGAAVEGEKPIQVWELKLEADGAPAYAARVSGLSLAWAAGRADERDSGPTGEGGRQARDRRSPARHRVSRGLSLRPLSRKGVGRGRRREASGRHHDGAPSLSVALFLLSHGFSLSGVLPGVVLCSFNPALQRAGHHLARNMC